MTHFISQNGVYTTMPLGMVEDKLPLGTYSVGLDPNRGYFLSQIEDIKTGYKIYGNVTRRANRIINTFLDRPHSTGVLLMGRKGTGKTMLAKMVSEQCLEKLGICTLIINSPLSGEGFNKFITSITQPCVVIFDEFEKVYSIESQEELLTLFDGVYPSKKLFLMTSNNPYEVSHYLLDRPGRVFYKFEYGAIPMDEISEYLNDNLKDKNMVAEVSSLCSMVKDLSYDILKAICEDVNRYPDTDLDETFSALNITNGGGGNHYQVKEGTGVWKKAVGETFRASPFSSNILLKNILTGEQLKGVNKNELENSWFSSEDITEYTDREVSYKNKQGDLLTLVRVEPETKTFKTTYKRTKNSKNDLHMARNSVSWPEPDEDEDDVVENFVAEYSTIGFGNK